MKTLISDSGAVTMAKLDTVSKIAQLGCQSWALTTMTKKIPANGERFMSWALASRAPSSPTRCFSSVSLRSTRQAEVAPSIPDEIFSGEDEVELSILRRWRLRYVGHPIRTCRTGPLHQSQPGCARV